jgi:hypothetical protein
MCFFFYSVRPSPFASQPPDSSRHINMRKRTLAPASLYQTLRAKGTLYTIVLEIHYILSYIIIYIHPLPQQTANPSSSYGRKRLSRATAANVCELCSILLLY